MCKILRTFFIVLLNMCFLLAHANIGDTTGIPGTEPSSEKDSLQSPQKICSCKLLKVPVNNYESQTVGIFAEKTPEAKPAADYKLMNDLLVREAVYFSVAFTKSDIIKKPVTSATDCITLYKKLKAENGNFKMYSILDVDALKVLVKK
jgi:hypothetical protein